MSGKNNIKTKHNSWINRIMMFSLMTFLAFVIADLVLLSYRSYFLPKEVSKNSQKKSPPSPILSRDYFQPIINRNIFASNGEIPPEILPKGVEKKQKIEDPIPTTLPLNLVGTLVHSNPAKSIAAIELKSKNQIMSFSVGKEIDNLAKIEKIERGKVIFRNNSADRLEYIEMKENSKLSFDAKPIAKPSAKPNDAIIQKSGDNKFELKRSDLEEKLKDIQSILMQARAVPAKKPGTGETYGFRLLEIQPDSIFTSLGLQVMDVITGVNGTPVTTSQQALEMYQTLRNSNQIKINVERGGKSEELSYSVK